MAEQVAHQVSRRHLTLPAILMLEIAKPFSFIASQGLLLCQPLLGFFYDEARIMDYVDLLADRSMLDRLIASLEAGSGDGKEKSA